MSGSYPALNVGQGVPAPTNPLALASQAQGVQANMLAIQQQQAKIAVGQAYQAATDPTTGQVDQGKFRSLVAADPRASFDAQDAGGTSMLQTGQTTQNDQTSLNLQHAKMGFLAGLAAPLAANPNTTKQDVANQFQHAMAFGHVDAPTAQAALDSIPDSPAGVHQALGTFLKANMTPTDEYAHIYGTGGQVNNGATTLSGTVAPADAGGGFSPASSTTTQLSPGDLSQPTALGTTPTGQTVMGTKAQFLARVNGGGAPDPTFGTGRMTPVPGAQPGGGIAMGLAPGQTAAMTAAGQGSGDAYVAAQNRASSFSTRQYQAQTALGALQALGPTGVGPGSAGRNQIVSYAQSLGFTAPSDQVKAYDEANKYLTASAMQQPGATSSEGQLASALSANASTHISGLASQDVVKATIALDRQNQGALLAFNQSGQNPANWQKFATNWSSTVDPRVYAFDLMSPQQRTTMMGPMSAADKSKFYGQVQQAVGLGLVKPPSQAQPAASAAPATPAGPAQVPFGDQ